MNKDAIISSHPQRIFHHAVESITVQNDVATVGNMIHVTCPFLITNEGNENDRYYMKQAVEPEVVIFEDEVMKHPFGNHAVMELEHPPIENDELYFRVSQERGCGRVIKLWWEEDILMGTYETSLDFPMAHVIIGYHKLNIPIGVSVRSMVSYVNKKNLHLHGFEKNINFRVVDLIKIITWDSVMNPGFDNARRLSVIADSKDYIMDNINNKYVPATEEAYKSFDKSMQKIPKGVNREKYMQDVLSKTLLKFT